MVKIPKDRYTELYEIDGVRIRPNSGQIRKQKIHVVVSREKMKWEISLTSEYDDIMLMVPFNEPLRDIVEEILRVTKKEETDD